MDLLDAGSHPDLTFDLMERSIGLVGGYLAAVAASLGRGEPLAAQVALARDAEARMLARFATNTHKGALFLGGALLCARARAGADAEPALRAALATVARDLAAAAPPPATGTHGASARARFGVRGILGEVARGLPSVFEVALPAWRAARERGEGPDLRALRMLAALMRTVEDTTALHRCGPPGLATVKADGAALEAALDTGAAAAVAFLGERNEAWRAMRLTMGGVADLLGVALGWLAYRRDVR